MAVMDRSYCCLRARRTGGTERAIRRRMRIAMRCSRYLPRPMFGQSEEDLPTGVPGDLDPRPILRRPVEAVEQMTAFASPDIEERFGRSTAAYRTPRP